MSYNLLKGKKGIIFGALNEQSIAWKVAEKAVEEGYIAGAMEQKAIDDALLVNVWHDFVKMTDSIRRVYISDLLPKGGEK